jgi:hypothetical protein
MKFDELSNRVINYLCNVTKLKSGIKRFIILLRALRSQPIGPRV